MKKIIFACSVLLLTVMTTTAQRRTTTTSRRSEPVQRRTSSSEMSSTGLANTILLYGELGFGSQKDPDEKKTNGFNFNPGIGYQFNDNWAVGLAARVFSGKVDPKGDDNTTKTSELEIGPFIRYTQPLSGIFNIYGQLDLGFQSTKNDPPGNNDETKSNGFYGRIVPAVQVNLKNNFAFNVGFGLLGFSTLKVDADGVDNGTTNIDFNFGGQGFILGVSKNF